MKPMRILIVEDTPERQEILIELCKDHAWILAHTAARARRLLEAYLFDLIFLDYDLATEERGTEVAIAIAASDNRATRVVIHSQNAAGVDAILKILPRADAVPISRMIHSNATFRRLRAALGADAEIDWGEVLGGEG